MKRTPAIVIFALFSLLLVLLSCTLPIYIVTSPEAVVEADDEEEKELTATPANTATPEPVATATMQVTPTVSVNLDGPWTIWQGTSEQQLDINFMQKDFSVTANAATGDGHSLLIEGTISHDGASVSGEWESTNGTSGNFVMYLDDAYSMFSGNMGGGVPFCGNRLDATMPSPCLK